MFFTKNPIPEKITYSTIDAELGAVIAKAEKARIGLALIVEMLEAHESAVRAKLAVRYSI
jgi:hypothetical protein